MEKIHVIGTGMGSGCITEELRSLIRDADLVVGGSRLLSRFPETKGKGLTIKSPLEEVIHQLKGDFESGKRVVVLADGDPLFFGIGRHLLKVFSPQNLTFYPNVTALQAAAATLGLPWDQVKTVSIHGRDDIWPLLRAMTFFDFVGVYTSGEDGPGRIARELLCRGIDTFQLVVLENLGYEDQRIREFRVDEVEGQSFFLLNFVLLRRVKPPPVALKLGIPDERFVHERGLITKREVRSVGLASLQVESGDTVWDLGAGSGSVAIEASYLARDGRVYAVEKEKSRVEMIKENLLRTGAYHVEVVHGTMPECLQPLPDPHKIFFGGGLASGMGVLEEACHRLRPGGRIVVHTVLISSLESSLALFRGLDWEHDIVQVHVSRSTPISSSIGERGEAEMMLKALNPVFVISAQKPL